MLQNLVNVAEDTVKMTVSSYAKIYPTGIIRLFVYQIPKIQNTPGFEKQQKQTHPEQKFEVRPTSPPNTPLELLNKELNLERSIRRTRTTISDLTLSNDFDMFATFTFKSDRQNVEKSKQKMSNWLKSQQKKHGKFHYLIVPEYHKDKKSIHFHALLKNYKGLLTDSKKTIKGRKVFNINSYRSGFSTVVIIDDISKVSSYIRKYIVKDMPIFDNRKRYWCSAGLVRPKVAYNLQPTGLMRKVFSNDLYTIYEGIPTIEQLQITALQDILSLPTKSE